MDFLCFNKTISYPRVYHSVAPTSVASAIVVPCYASEWCQRSLSTKDTTFVRWASCLPKLDVFSSNCANIILARCLRECDIHNLVGITFLCHRAFSRWYFIAINIMVVRQVNHGNVLRVWRQSNCINTSRAFIKFKSLLLLSCSRVPDKDCRWWSNLTCSS